MTLVPFVPKMYHFMETLVTLRQSCLSSLFYTVNRKLQMERQSYRPGWLFVCMPVCLSVCLYNNIDSIQLLTFVQLNLFRILLTIFNLCANKLAETTGSDIAEVSTSTIYLWKVSNPLSAALLQVRHPPTPPFPPLNSKMISISFMWQHEKANKLKQYQFLMR